jgi:hypothetical protein
MVVDERDIPCHRFNAVMEDIALSMNQGGASTSTGIQHGDMRRGRPRQMTAARSWKERRARVLRRSIGFASRSAPDASGMIHRSVCRAGDIIGIRCFNVIRHWKIGSTTTRPAPLARASRRNPTLQDHRPVHQALARRAEGLGSGQFRHRHAGVPRGSRPFGPVYGSGRRAHQHRGKRPPGRSRTPRRMGQKFSRCSCRERIGGLRG